MLFTWAIDMMLSGLVELPDNSKSTIKMFKLAQLDYLHSHRFSVYSLSNNDQKLFFHMILYLPSTQLS